jgi:hypothetical protein
VPLPLLTHAIATAPRPLLLRFHPRELWYGELESACYDLVYRNATLGVEVMKSPKTGLPVVVQPPTHSQHVSHSFMDKHKPDAQDQIIGVKKLGERAFEMLISHPNPFERLAELIRTEGRPLTLRYLPPPDEAGRREAAAAIQDLHASDDEKDSSSSESSFSSGDEDEVDQFQQQQQRQLLQLQKQSEEHHEQQQQLQQLQEYQEQHQQLQQYKQQHEQHKQQQQKQQKQKHHHHHHHHHPKSAAAAVKEFLLKGKGGQPDRTVVLKRHVVTFEHHKLGLHLQEGEEEAFLPVVTALVEGKKEPKVKKKWSDDACLLFVLLGPY